MKYLSLIDLPSTDLTAEEEAHLDCELAHDAWCRKNQGSNGRPLHISEAAHVFKDDIYFIALDLQASGDDSLMKYIRSSKNKELDEKKRMAKQVPIKSLVKTEIRQNKAICPFHEDSNASMHVYEETNSYYCFTCDAGGDVIDYVQRLNGCTFVEAVNLLT